MDQRESIFKASWPKRTDTFIPLNGFSKPAANLTLKASLWEFDVLFNAVSTKPFQTIRLYDW